jgi:hypothetical protein
MASTGLRLFLVVTAAIVAHEHYHIGWRRSAGRHTRAHFRRNARGEYSDQ